MSSAADVQINTGPTASVVHHAAAWVQEVAGIGAVEALLAVLGGSAVGIVAVSGLVALVVQRFSRFPQ